MKLDHVVYFTYKPSTQIVEEQRANGQHAVVGGRHEKWGTHNALLYVKNAYIEWLSVERLGIAREAKHPLTDLLLNDLQENEGWGTVCLSVEDIESFNEEIKNKGFRTSGVLAAERKTADGNLRKWKMLFVDQIISDELPMPFFIEWEDTEESRLTMLRNDGTITHENEKSEIKECVFKVSNPQKMAASWAHLVAKKVGQDSTIVLSNSLLRFSGQKGGKDRLTDVVVEQTK
ncbi:VOC family protein [Filibacter tadaridae]|uniref:VOC family protein n=1 Tax=Filibacter tadaridae TaxID=2483811 RepID=UPI001EF0256A|nr:VOC family protein [Filibacter tadaridae]